MPKHTRRRHWVVTGIAFGAVFLALGGVSSALPNADGTVSGCVDKRSGALRVIETGSCTAKESAVTLASNGLVLTGDLTGTLASPRLKQCAAAQVLKYNGSAWACAADDVGSGGGGGGTVTSVGTGAGLVGGPITTSGLISLLGCPAGQILKSTGSSWSCGADVDTTNVYSAATGGGVTVTATSGGGLIGLLGGCTSGQLLKYTGTSWACGSDNDHAYSASLGDGIAFTSANTFGLKPCVTGKVLKSTGGGWGCADDNDIDTNTTYTAEDFGGLALNGTSFSLIPCGAGEVLTSTGGNWECGSQRAPTEYVYHVSGADQYPVPMQVATSLPAGDYVAEARVQFSSTGPDGIATCNLTFRDDFGAPIPGAYDNWAASTDPGTHQYNASLLSSGSIAPGDETAHPGDGDAFVNCSFAVPDPGTPSGTWNVTIVVRPVTFGS
jgi:hypothetical protein